MISVMFVEFVARIKSWVPHPMIYQLWDPFNEEKSVVVVVNCLKLFYLDS